MILLPNQFAGPPFASPPPAAGTNPVSGSLLVDSRGPCVSACALLSLSNTLRVMGRGFAGHWREVKGHQTGSP